MDCYSVWLGTLFETSGYMDGWTGFTSMEISGSAEVNAASGWSENLRSLVKIQAFTHRDHKAIWKWLSKVRRYTTCRCYICNSTILWFTQEIPGLLPAVLLFVLAQGVWLACTECWEVRTCAWQAFTMILMLSQFWLFLVHGVAFYF